MKEERGTEQKKHMQGHYVFCRQRALGISIEPLFLSKTLKNMCVILDACAFSVCPYNTRKIYFNSPRLPSSVEKHKPFKLVSLLTGIKKSHNLFLNLQDDPDNPHFHYAQVYHNRSRFVVVYKCVSFFLRIIRAFLSFPFSLAVATDTSFRHRRCHTNPKLCILLDFFFIKRHA